ncbi:DUF1648 domain-containing protein [Cellulophaga sp. HaHaR_3_176]|uniref:DUF1648 domain-containing protein n=1 Tax=Cellulophaga sp. HaHaR_3_176 TaxID=1942464 RepID=UPI001C1FE070|nr:DUF1648 domain-containing protein [Cellulophaga sp. HaHaR_3_176]QWX83017.1 DUF1648 domain-containing protein [Cellulophaga sp. HaHaR_3_176]
MREKPKIKLDLANTDKVIEITGWTLLVGTWLLAILSFSDLPESIPTHFNAAGKADGFGGKNTIFVLPFIGTILFFGMTMLNKNPHIFNYPKTITNENALSQYANATRMIRVLKLIIAFVFGLILVMTLQHTNGNTDGLGVWFLPLTISLFIIPTLYFFIKAMKINSNKKNH